MKTVTCQESLVEAAVRVGDVTTLGLLLQSGFSPTHKGVQVGEASQQHSCALLNAAVEGKVEMVEILLEYSANPNCKHCIRQPGKRGTTQEEIRLILPDVVKKYIDNIRNDTIHDYFKIIKLLINYGVWLDLTKVKDVYTVITHGRTLSVVKALQSDIREVIVLLINCGLIGLPPLVKKLFGILDIHWLKTEETKVIEDFLKHSILAGKKIQFILKYIEKHKKKVQTPIITLV